MNDETNDDTVEERDPLLDAAGAELREVSAGLDPSAVRVDAVNRRARRRGIGLVVASIVAVVAVTAGSVAALSGRGGSGTMVAGGGGGPEVDRIVSSLASRPIDPTKVRLVSTVKTFRSCDALLGDLRRVGAEHVGSRGFGAGTGMTYSAVASAVADEKASASALQAAPLPATDGPGGPVAGGAGAGETLGTNVQVDGVDELDRVKADGKWIYDLDGHGSLRVTDSSTLQVVGTVRIVPDRSTTSEFGPVDSLDSLLEDAGRIVVFGSRTVTSKPVPGDPSATRSSTQYLTATFVDATDPAKPTVTDQVRVEGTLVSARMVNGQIRVVTTSNMDDLGFVMPTTPTSVAKALDRNRRSVAGSKVADWIPDWQRDGGTATPLVPCERVHVPDTFAGVAMTSLVSFPIGTGRFAPEATSILAPGDTLYAGVDDVAVSAQVWVDPIDRAKLHFDDWKTAIHEFSFATDGPPTYTGSGIVEGSTVGQFAFGEVGDSLGVVTTKGTPWDQSTSNSVDLVLLAKGGSDDLVTKAKLTDLAGGKGSVDAVRFVPDRVLVSTGVDGTLVRVVDVSDPSKPRAAGTVTLPGPIGYFHPLADHRALLVGSRSDDVPFGDDTVPRQWVRAELLDVSDADHPKVTGDWETPWASDEVGTDHHAFTFWSARNLAMWGIGWNGYNSEPQPNHAVVLGVGDGLAQKALPEALQPPEVAAPCPQIPVDDPDLQRIVGEDAVVLGCADASKTELEWPRWTCSHVDKAILERYAPDRVGKGSVFMCNPAPLPTVARVLVVNGRPILYTDQTLEALDPDTFASTRVVYHPSTLTYGGGWIG